MISRPDSVHTYRDHTLSLVSVLSVLDRPQPVDNQAFLSPCNVGFFLLALVQDIADRPMAVGDLHSAALQIELEREIAFQ